MSRPAPKLQEHPVQPSRVCPDCNLRRVEREYRTGGTEYRNCRNCWAKQGRKKQ